jgi:hypothetical protein
MGLSWRAGGIDPSGSNLPLPHGLGGFVGLVRASLLGAGLETVPQHAPANLMLS